jgi:hypothetical protein
MIPNEANLNLGMIGNCTISALIDAQARMVWCCMPRFDSDPVSHALLAPRTSAAASLTPACC